MPSQNVGMHWPASASAIAPESRSEPRRTAARMPSGSEMSTASTMAATASVAVAGNRSRTSGSVGWRCRRERPKSPWTARARKCPYCSGSGRSNPRAVRMMS